MLTTKFTVTWALGTSDKMKIRRQVGPQTLPKPGWALLTSLKPPSSPPASRPSPPPPPPPAPSLSCLELVPVNPSFKSPLSDRKKMRYSEGGVWTLLAKTYEVRGVGRSGVCVQLASHAWLVSLTGDCWFLAALGSLTQNPHLLQKILMDQSFSYQYAGIFCFRVCALLGCSYMCFSVRTGWWLSWIFFWSGSLRCGRDTYLLLCIAPKKDLSSWSDNTWERWELKYFHIHFFKGRHNQQESHWSTTRTLLNFCLCLFLCHILLFWLQ